MSAHHTIRASSDSYGLSLDTLRQHVPSVFADKPANNMSGRYGFIPTVAVVEELQKTGLQVVQAGQTVARKSDGHLFTRHVLRFRPQSAPALSGQTLPEVVLVNSHNGASGFKLWAGLFRMVCANGLIIADSTIGAVSVPHRSNALSIVASQSLDFLGRIDNISERVERFMSIELSDEQSYTLADHAASLRWGSERPAGLNHRDLLTARRYDDARRNLWHVMNNIQENIVRGGVSLLRPKRRSSTRGMRSVQEDIRFNARLWGAAETLARGDSLVQDVEDTRVLDSVLLDTSS
jgi:hypothetical protein